MKPVSELYGRHEGADIYVVGSATSMRVFPTAFLEDKITIGLNTAWRVAPVQYSLTIGPHLHVPEFLGEPAHPEITWITKRGKAVAVLTPEQLEHAEQHFYDFRADGQPNTQPLEEPSDAGRVLDWVRRPTGDFLYQWSSISQTAVNLAANLGARSVILVGCDNCALAENFHAAEGQHTKWMGATPDRRFDQYYEGLVEIRSVMRERGIPVVSLDPFLKLDEPERDFRQLCGELERPVQTERGPDISEVDHPRRFADTPRPARSLASRIKRRVTKGS
jgi:hypothetical protein